MAIKYEISCKTGEYQDNQGQTKSRYQKIGVVLETKSGMALKLECVPVGWDGWAYLNTPKPKENTGTAASANADDIPF